MNKIIDNKMNKLQYLEIENQKFYIINSAPFSTVNNFLDLKNQLLGAGFQTDAIIDVEEVNKFILGSTRAYNPFNDKEGYFNLGTFSSNGNIINIISEILKTRFQQKLPVILFGNWPAYSKLEKYLKIASAEGYSTQVLFYQEERDMILNNHKNSEQIYPPKVLNLFLDAYEASLNNNQQVFDKNTKVSVLPNLVKHKDLEVIGDVHGMLEDLKKHLAKKDWEFNDEKQFFYHADKNKALMFIGDLLDRHPDSVKLLRVVYNTHKKGQAYFLLGNHEAKLLNSFSRYKEDGLVRGKSLSSSQTFSSFLRLKPKDRKELYEFVLTRPSSYCMWINKDTLELTTDKDKADIKLGFVHADVSSFNPFNNPVSTALYGSTHDFKASPVSEDVIYQKGFDLGINEYIVFRGHCFQHTEVESIYSLEYDQAFEGHLASINMVQYIHALKENKFKPQFNLFKENTEMTKTEYNFDKENKTSIGAEMFRLEELGLVSNGWSKDEEGNVKPNKDGFKIYKYKKHVHFDRLWKTEKYIEKARGLVLDIGGKIVVHPFDKLYNFEEYDSGKHLTPESMVRYSEKLNGFLGCISPHPYNSNELILSTTGSLTSPYVKFIADLLTPEKRNQLTKFFAEEGHQTLMFEVIHPEDPHIIKYLPEQQGLWLIGARGLNETDKIKTELELDSLAEKLSFPRGYHGVCKFGELLEKLKTCNHEGYMVWEIKDNGEEVPIMKIKSDYYLVTKFLARMSEKKIDLLYKNPRGFQQTVDEEFYPLVEYIASNVDKEKFIKMEEQERIDIIKEFIDAQRNTIVKKNKI